VAGLPKVDIPVNGVLLGWGQFAANLPKRHVPGVFPGWQVPRPKRPLDILYHAFRPTLREGLVDDKKNRANDSGGGPDGDPQDGDTETAQAVSPNRKKKDIKSSLAVDHNTIQFYKHLCDLLTENPAGGPPDDNDHPGLSEWRTAQYVGQGLSQSPLYFTIYIPPLLYTYTLNVRQPRTR